MVLEAFFWLLHFFYPVHNPSSIFLPVHIRFYPSKWQVDGSLDKAMIHTNIKLPAFGWWSYWVSQDHLFYHPVPWSCYVLTHKWDYRSTELGDSLNSKVTWASLYKHGTTRHWDRGVLTVLFHWVNRQYGWKRILLFVTRHEFILLLNFILSLLFTCYAHFMKTNEMNNDQFIFLS